MRTVRQLEISTDLMNRAVDTFGSGAIPEKWLCSECGALNRKTPLGTIRSRGSEVEVEHILDCIDHGMIA